eukprot:9101975-Pyramimonas_sp.AAC.1
MVGMPLLIFGGAWSEIQYRTQHPAGGTRTAIWLHSLLGIFGFWLLYYVMVLVTLGSNGGGDSSQ